jgi:hypothetical protein
MFQRDDWCSTILPHGFNTINDKKEDKKMTEEEIKKIALKAVKEALEQAKDAKTGWTPHRNEDYVTVDGGRIDTCVNFNQSTTDAAIAAGQCFKTKKEAEDYIEWLKAFKTLRDDAQGYKFDDAVDNYFVECAPEDGELSTESDSGYINQLIYFESAELAAESIEKHAREWKIFYGVKEG